MTSRTRAQRPSAGGLTEPERHKLAELVDDPRLLVHSHLLYSTSGQRPAG